MALLRPCVVYWRGGMGRRVGAPSVLLSASLSLCPCPLASPVSPPPPTGSPEELMSPGLAVSVEHPDYCPALLPYFITCFTTYFTTYYRYTVLAYLLHTSPILPWVYWTLRFDENYY